MASKHTHASLYCSGVRSPQWTPWADISISSLLLEAPEGNPAPCCFSSEKLPAARARGRSLPLQSRQRWVESSRAATSLVLPLLPPRHRKDPCDYAGPSQIVPDNLPILRPVDSQPVSRASFLSLCQVKAICSQVLGSFGGVVLLTMLALPVKAALDLWCHWLRACHPKYLLPQGVAAVGGWVWVSFYFSKAHRVLTVCPAWPHVPASSQPRKGESIIPILQMRTVRLREGTWLVHVAALGLIPGGLGPCPRLLLLACELTGNAAGGDVKCVSTL